MPPSIPTSLNFADSNTSRLVRWPKNVLTFLQAYLSRKNDRAQEQRDLEDDQVDAKTNGLVKELQSKPARKVSRADPVEGQAAGISLCSFDVGLQPDDDTFSSAKDSDDPEAHRQSLLNATESVISSVRTLIRNFPRSSTDNAHPKILLFGRHAEVRAQYLAHSCGFGVESGNLPEDCAWPLVDQDGEVVLRDGEGLHWSEDLNELFGIKDGSFDIILAFNVQLNPSDLAVVAPSAFSGLPPPILSSSTMNSGRQFTQQWMEKLTAVLREGGVFAGIACLEPSASTPAVGHSGPSAFTPIAAASTASIGSNSPAFGSRAAAAAASSLSRASPAPLSASPAPSPTFAHDASSSSPFASMRMFRDRLEQRFGFFVHACADLGLEGRPVLHIVDDALIEGAGAFSPYQAPASSSATAVALPASLERLVLSRFLATKARSSLTTVTVGVIAPSPIARRGLPQTGISLAGVTLQRSNSSGALIPIAPSSTRSRSPSSNTSSRSREHSTSRNGFQRPTIATHLSVSTSSAHNDGSVGSSMSLSARSAAAIAAAKGGVSPSPASLHPGASPVAATLDMSRINYPLGQIAHQPYSSSGHSSASPSPKLSPSESTESIQMLSSVYALNQLALAGTSGVHPFSASHRRSISNASPHSATSSRSSPAFAPATPTGFVLNPPEPLVISGVSLGLPVDAAIPAEERLPIFSKVNFDRIFAGNNFIQPMSDKDKADVVSMNSCQIMKDKATGARVKHYLKADAELIQVCSKMPARSEWKLGAEYGLPSHVMEVLDATYELAVCAGLEALKDAGFDIHLSSSNPAEVGLPESMRDETGVIFASSFPSLDSIIQEVTACVRAETATKLCEQLNVPRPTDKEYAYEYDRKLLFKLLVMANCQLAELVKARGPNIHINTACSGTTQAISTGEDWLKVGRCKRVIVISADVATNATCLKYLATGFLALGAASILPGPLNAAAPFDARRKGMILGAGSVGLVLEYATACIARGGTPKVELVGSHQGNSAFHATLMDSISISQQLTIFLKRVECEKGLAISTPEFARDLLYLSHETSTSANGGCAKVEMEALAAIWSDEKGLGAARREILISNTKGLTGHPMGVGFEDAVAVEALHRGLVPPVANFKTLDPRLSHLIGPDQISKGGSHTRNYILRMAGGFGNQFAYCLYRKWTDAMQTTWATRLAAHPNRTQAYAWERKPAYYHYDLQSLPSDWSPNSTRISRSSSSSSLQSLLLP